MGNLDSSGINVGNIAFTSGAQGELLISPIDPNSAQSINFQGTEIYGNSLHFQDYSITNYTIQGSDNGKFLSFDSSSATDITIPSGLNIGFNCEIMQKGIGEISFITDPSVTLNNVNSKTKIRAQFGLVRLICYGSGEFLLEGDTDLDISLGDSSNDDTDDEPTPDDSRFNVEVNLSDNILASSPNLSPGQVNIAFGLDDQDLYVYDGTMWSKFKND